MTPERDPFAGPYLSSRDAAAYVCCKTVKAFREWRRRHQIPTRSNGSVLRADLDRELARPKPRRVLPPASLANLRRRRRAPERQAS